VVAVTIDGERRVAHLVGAFGELSQGQLGLVVDSQGMFALAYDQHSAAADLRIGAGDAVVLSEIDDEGGAGGRAVPVALRPSRPPENGPR
jgi:S-adenosylmethionine hydrolase